MTDLELPENLEIEMVSAGTFNALYSIKRIVVPLKVDIFRPGVFITECPQLEPIELVGEVHKTIVSPFESGVLEKRNE